MTADELQPEDEDVDPRKSERGVSLPLVALMLVTLLGLAAFAVDLGWFYLNASRIQRAADAGALAGVIWMPDDFTTASAAAHEITRTNGYEDGVDSAVVVVDPVVSKPTQLRVTITDNVPTFFLRVFGMVTQNIVRSAQAEFVPPLPMGSPDNQFGNSCDPLQPGCIGQANFWANIHGRYTDNEMGDAYSSACTDGSGSPCGSYNPLWDDGGTSPGYLYGVESSGAFSIQFTDVEFHNSSGGVNNGDYVRTGDNGCPGLGGDMQANCGPTIQISLYEPDPDPLDLTNNVLLCQTNVSPQPQVAAGAPYNWIQHAGCFTVNSPSSGIYIVQVRVMNIGPNPDGLNRYSVRSTAGRLYAIDNMSIYNNATGSTTAFHLAEVDDVYAGKTFVVELYDAGESAAPGDLQV
ncbi:MAG TPA: Tad domain-containing protein, partial [Acidimicrobiia bacterium]